MWPFVVDSPRATPLFNQTAPRARTVRCIRLRRVIISGIVFREIGWTFIPSEHSRLPAGQIVKKRHHWDSGPTSGRSILSLLATPRGLRKSEVSAPGTSLTCLLILSGLSPIRTLPNSKVRVAGDSPGTMDCGFQALGEVFTS